MSLSRNDINLVLAIMIPNMANGFEIKINTGETLIVNPQWECCQAFTEALRDEMISLIKKRPYRVYGYN